VAVTVTLLFALVLLGSIEMIQLFNDERGCTATDVVLNVSGTAVGVILARMSHQWGAEPNPTAKIGRVGCERHNARVFVVFGAHREGFVGDSGQSLARLGEP